MDIDTLAVRFWPKVEKTDGCWLWTGARDKLGYGWIRRTRGGNAPAYRVAWELEVGPIPEGLVIDHLCRNPSCVNPAHLEPVTQRENMLRGATVAARNAAKTRCLRGHPLSGENLYRRPDGGRECRTCRAAAVARFHERRRRAA